LPHSSTELDSVVRIEALQPIRGSDHGGNMPHQIGLVFLGVLGILFGSYGFVELAQAYRTASLDEWQDKALPGAGGVIVGVMFAVMAFQALG
jgi:hypothetical protein